MQPQCLNRLITTGTVQPSVSMLHFFNCNQVQLNEPLDVGFLEIIETRTHR